MGGGTISGLGDLFISPSPQYPPILSPSSLSYQSGSGGAKPQNANQAYNLK